MNVQELHVNRNGVNAMKHFAADPNILSGTSYYWQTYLPGVTIPGIEGLNRRAFNIPIVGHEFPASIAVETVTHPGNFRGAPFRRTRLVTGLPEYVITTGKPTYQGYGIGNDAFGKHTNEEINTLFFKCFGDYSFIDVAIGEEYVWRTPTSRGQKITNVLLAQIVTFPKRKERETLERFENQGFGAYETLIAMKARFGKES